MERQTQPVSGKAASESLKYLAVFSRQHWCLCRLQQWRSTAVLPEVQLWHHCIWERTRPPCCCTATSVYCQNILQWWGRHAGETHLPFPCRKVQTWMIQGEFHCKQMQDRHTGFIRQHLLKSSKSIRQICASDAAAAENKVREWVFPTPPIIC